jgi:hypothetical protein
MRLLLAAGDADGWRHLDAVARALPGDGARCLALCRAGLPPVAHVPTITVGDGEAPERAVERALAGHDFAAALLATSRMGPDSLTKAVALGCAGVPVAAIQEYWGDPLGIEPGDGAALRYLVRDELAARLTAARAPQAQVRVTGSPKYAAFERHDIEAARRERRQEAGVREGTPLVGWFGQAPLAEESYRRTLEAFAAALAARGGARAVYRPHPRESAEQAVRSVAVLRESGVDARVATSGETWQWLAAVDAVFACFSNCCADAAHLNRVSARPLNASAFMLFDAELRRYHERATAMPEPPLATLGLALQARHESRIAGTIEEALDAATAERQWSAARRMLPLGSDAAAAVARELARREAPPRAAADKERT